MCAEQSSNDRPGLSLEQRLGEVHPDILRRREAQAESINGLGRVVVVPGQRDPVAPCFSETMSTTDTAEGVTGPLNFLAVRYAPLRGAMTTIPDCLASELQPQNMTTCELDEGHYGDDC